MTQEIKTPIKAIRAKCLDCSGWSSHEVDLCVIPDCPLFPYRTGKHPKLKGRVLTEEQREAVKKRLSIARARKKEAAQ